LAPFTRLRFETRSFEKLTHYWIRYPAKFHPPVVRHLVEEYTSIGDTVLDPFCGSGSLLVEALAAGRHAIGTDIDPLAVFATRVKTRRYNVDELVESANWLHRRLGDIERPPEEYFLGQFEDIKTETAISVCRRERLPLPPIPNLFHWFRARVVVDLARILKVIAASPIPASHRDFFRLAFAGILRAASNADPVPVSGLEVTSHMQMRDALGRVINPFDLFWGQIEKGIPGVMEFNALVPTGVKAVSRRGDASRLGSIVRKEVNAIITSPPYNNAVDYYRRHALEVYWLGLVEGHTDRQLLRNHYIGRGGRARHRFVTHCKIDNSLCTKWYSHILADSAPRAAAFKHYVVAMEKMFRGAAQRLPKSGLALFVVGHSSWNGDEIPTSDLFEGMAGRNFRLIEKLWYPVQNRSMSYARHNGADISGEYVLVFERAS
jgi:hypothetical protein